MGEHAYSAYLPWQEQASCWCQPLVEWFGVPPEERETCGLYPIVFHRPFAGFVFWERGEHGPYGLDAILTEDPVFEDLDRG